MSIIPQRIGEKFMGNDTFRSFVNLNWILTGVFCFLGITIGSFKLISGEENFLDDFDFALGMLCLGFSQEFSYRKQIGKSIFCSVIGFLLVF